MNVLVLLHRVVNVAMLGKQAKILSETHITKLLDYSLQTRHPVRDRALVLLSVKAGLRAAEIANLTWEMVLDPSGSLKPTIDLQNQAAKKGSGRRIPIHGDLAEALTAIRKNGDYVILSERGGRMHPMSIVNWFAKAYRVLDLAGCSSHSGRRTFITRAARLVHRAGGSLRDVQILAGHSSIQTTQRYIDGDSDVQRKLVSLL